MGLFNGYMKEGKGISKEDAKKRKYFETLKDHFWDLIKLNLLYCACNIPMLVIFALLAVPLWLYADIDEYINQLVLGNIVIIFWLLLPLVPFVLSGPFTAGLTYVTRNYVRHEHAFLVSDFLEHSKKNIKQGLIMNLITFVVFVLYSSAAFFYVRMTGGSIIVSALLLVIGIILLCMAFYTFPMIVSFDMKLKDIIKNSWIFATLKLPQNLFYLIIIIAVHGVLIYVKGIWVVFMPIILISWTSFTINYYAWHVIEKYMQPDKANNEGADFDKTENNPD